MSNETMPGNAGIPAAVRVKTINHITLVVADLERSKGFYCGLLGMEEVPRPGFSFPGKWFQAGPTQIHLILEHEGSAPAGCPTPGGKASAGRATHFAFEVADAQMAYDYLKSRGANLRGEPKFRPDGYLQVFLQDPDGYIVEVYSWPAE